ncbi:MAG: hypothetical protein ACOYL6_19015 [Bacteriovoracaceae bacterium]
MKLTKRMGIILLLCSSVCTYAQQDPDAFRKALDTCITETGVPKLERGAKPADADKAKMDTCLTNKGFKKPENEKGGNPMGGDRPPMDEKIKAAFDECFTSTGVKKLERGQKPTEEDKTKMDKCLAAKGITPPNGGGQKSK